MKYFIRLNSFEKYMEYVTSPSDPVRQSCPSPELRIIFDFKRIHIARTGSYLLQPFISVSVPSDSE